MILHQPTKSIILLIHPLINSLTQLPIYLPNILFIHPTHLIHPTDPIHSSIYQPIHPSTLLINPLLHPSTCLLTYSLNHLSIYPTLNLHNHPLIHLSILHQPIYPHYTSTQPTAPSTHQPSYQPIHRTIQLHYIITLLLHLITNLST